MMKHIVKMLQARSPNFLNKVQRGFLVKKKALTEFIYPTAFDNLHLMPSNPALTLLERELESKYKINIEGLSCQTIVGIYQHEKEKGQPII